MKAPVEALLAGRAQSFRGSERSAIAKVPITGLIRILTEGLEGDEQADRKVHGGPHMALHHYPLEHHAFWREKIGEHRLLDDPGAFGTNLSARGFWEDAMHIGDQFRLGSALIEVSQPRRPCWKIEHRFGQQGMVKAILKSGRCGWYYRVLEEGEAKAGDMLELVGNGEAQWTIARAFKALWGDPPSTSIADHAALSKVAALTPKLRVKAAQHAEGDAG